MSFTRKENDQNEARNLMNESIVGDKVIVFGASGYIGRALVHGFLNKGFTVIAVSRSSVDMKHPNLRVVTINFSDFKLAEYGDVHTIIYCAGIAHNKYKDENLQLANVDLPGNVAKKCVNRVKKFIFISTVNVLDIGAGHPLNAKSEANPVGINARSKYDAECALRAIFDNSSTALTLVRCPMIYGNEAPGNFTLLVRLACYPLPFKENQTIRSMLHIENLVDLIFSLVSFEERPPLIFMPADSNPLKFNELLQTLSTHQGKKSSLFHINRNIIVSILKTVGLKNINQLFYNNLILDSQVYDRTFIWTAKMSHKEGLNEYFSHQELDIKS
jgi:nucleoside-diphosphate-sugar epimerase